MSQEFKLTIERWQIQAAKAWLSKMGAPGAFILGKVDKLIERLLVAFPTASKFELTAAAVDEKPVDADREASEEKAQV